MVSTRSWLYFFLCLLLISCREAVPDDLEVAHIAIIPQPQQVVPGSGKFVISAETTISVETHEQERAAVHFINQFSEVTGWAPILVKEPNVSGDIQLQPADNIPGEGYLLEITGEKVLLKANGGAGYFYAFQTLMQLLPASFMSPKSKGQSYWAIPSATIMDAPTFSWRGFMLDVSRHFFDIDQVKKVLDFMAAIKLNRFHWHLADDQGWRVEIKSYPKLTEIGAWRVDYINFDESISDWWGRPVQQPGDKPTYGGYYSQDEIREIVAYAKDRHIEIIPEIDMPGHAQATIAAYPEIGCVNAAPFVATGGVFKNNTYNPGKEETFVFAEKMLNELMDLFPFEYVHIGGDECNKEQWKIDPHAQQRMKDEGLMNEEELQSYFIKRIEKIINKRGRAMIGWDEILEGGLAPNATVMSWRGEEGGLAAAKAGHDVIMTPSQFCYLDLKQGPDDLEPNLGYSHMYLSSAYQYRIVPEGLDQDEARHILGTQANLWTESISDWGKLTYMTFPRIFAIAENAWTSEEAQDWDDFVIRLDPQLARLDARDIRYATSAFNVQISHRGLEHGIEITFDTEAGHLDYYYTLDGTEPDLTSNYYSGPFTLSESATVSARAFRDSIALGKTSRLEYPIHLAGDAAVNYHIPYLDYKDAAGAKALIDYNYASLSVSDDQWQGFAGDLDVTLNFPEPKHVSEVQLTTLRMTISGIYVPESFTVLGSADGVSFVEMGRIEQLEASHTQGRNKIRTRVPLEGKQVVALRIKAKSVNPIPAGHHRAGESSKIYVDEVVVL